LELLLNLVWAGIAATLLLLWAMPRLSHAHARRSAVALLALVCVVCILFPVISMTDDLNASPAEPETVKSKLAVLPHFLMTSGSWMLVYDPHQAAFCHEVEAQPKFSPPMHAFLSFLLTRRPPPQLA
jgi:UDP-N-acetylmuramyl pentapeptide phosphotransferase/UDP-N-acetylglucosamine-1-phosphate transferase